MVTYLLDTTACVDIIRGKPEVIKRLKTEDCRQIFIPTIVFFELYSGPAKLPKVLAERHWDKLHKLSALLPAPLSLNKEDAHRAALVRADLETRGCKIGPYDTLIAGQALARKFTLVTSNTDEFSRIPDLQLQDWRSPSAK